MTYSEIIEEKKEEFDAALEHMQEEFNKLRTGRANPSLVENLMVDYYGTPTALKQAANVTVPEARQILIQPWDKSMLDAIDVAIKKSDLGIAPSNDGVVLRITLPPMTEDNRRDLVKVLNQRAEEARIAIRAIREDVWKKIQAEQKDGAMSEDDKFAGKDTLQEVVDAYNVKVEEARKKKEEDIMTV